MRLTQLLEQMQLDISYYQIRMDEISDEACVLPSDTNPSPANIYVLKQDEIQTFLSCENGNHLCAFCSGNLPESIVIPEESNIVCFPLQTNFISASAQRALHTLRQKEHSSTGYGSLIVRLIEGKLQVGENVAELVRGLGLQLSKRFCLIMVSFFGNSENTPWESAVLKLRHILQQNSVFAYKGDIVVLLSLKENETVPTLPDKVLNDYLNSNSAYAAVSNSAVRLIAVKALYQQAKAAMRFGIALHQVDGKRVFLYEHYVNYHIAEFCANAYKSELKVNDLVYLCHPALGNVLRHDRKHDTNFAHVLRRFLENDCNMSQTARELFIHRNTMLNKLEKLQELLGVSLKDHSIREQLQFSFYVVDYIEKYLHEKVF